MEVIKNLIEQGYVLYNAGKETKLPENLYGNGVGQWQKLTYEQSKAHHNMNSMLWGIRTGIQGNGRYIMSLDFDICGKADKITGKRLGCEYTKKKYEEFLSIVDKEDGHYLSSTITNANVLIDYTNVASIREQAKKVKSKFSIKTFELLVGNGAYQVIPPSNTLCKINNDYIRAREFKNDKVFYVLTDDSPINDFILNLFNERYGTENNKKKDINQFIKNDDDDEDEDEDDIDEEFSNEDLTNMNNNISKLLSIIGSSKCSSGDNQDWTRVAQAIKNELKDDGLDLFLNWTETYGCDNKKKEAYNHYQQYIKYTSKTSSNRVAIGTLHHYAKLNNEKEYLKHFSKKQIQTDDNYISLEILDKGENDVAKNIKDELKKTLIYCNNKWFCLDIKTNLWSVIKIPYATIISHIQMKIDKSRLKTLEEKLNDDDKKKYDDIDKKFKDHYKKLTCGSYSSQISKLLQEYLHDSIFENKLDTIPYKMAYKNGIMDLKTSIFRNGILSTDYLTRTIQYDYKESTKEEQEEVKKELLKICNMNSGHLDYYLSSLGYALTGDASRLQQFYAIRGQSASNGKSVIFEALTKILPNYVLKLESNIMELNYGSRHKEVATWKGVRIAWINELSRKKQDENEIKNLSDGTALRFKVNYGEMDTMPITLKLFIVSNNTLNINADAGIARRLKMMQFNSQFIDGIEDNYETCEFEKKDNFIKDLCTKYKYSLMDLLYSYSKIFVNDNYKLKPYPKEWQEDSNDVVNDNNELHQYLKDNLEFGLNLEAGKKEVDEVITSFKKEIKMADFKDALSSLKVNYKYDSQKGFAGGKGKWTGFKVIL